MDRSSKEGLVSQMREKLEEATCIIVTNQTGLTVNETTELRRAVRDAGAEFKVLKNTLARLALAGTKHEAVIDLLKGPTALAYSAEPVGAAKASVNYANDNDKLSVVGGILDGRVLEKSEIEALAKLPSLDELRAKVISVITTPATRLAVIAKQPATVVARVLNAKAQKGE